MTHHPQGRAARLDRALVELIRQAPELEAAAVVSFDGLAMASLLPVGMDEDRVAAMSAALLSLGEKASQGLGRGDLSQVYVEGESGTVFLVACQDEAVLVAVAAAGSKAGLMLFEIRRAAQTIAEILLTDNTFYVDGTDDEIDLFEHVDTESLDTESIDTESIDSAALADAAAAYAEYRAAQSLGQPTLTQVFLPEAPSPASPLLMPWNTPATSAGVTEGFDPASVYVPDAPPRSGEPPGPSG